MSAHLAEVDSMSSLAAYECKGGKGHEDWALGGSGEKDRKQLEWRRRVRLGERVHGVWIREN